MFNAHQITASTEEAQEIPPQSGSSNVSGGGADMQGWDGVRFVASIGVITGAGTFDGYVTHSANSNFSGEVNVSGQYLGATTNAVLTQVTNTNQNTVSIIDIFRPTNRYVRFKAVPAVNTVAFAVNSLRYRRNGLLPPTHVAIQTIFLAMN